MINKKALSHIEVMISFVIFIGFLIFLIAVFKPFDWGGGEDVYLDILEREIDNYASVEVDFLSIDVDEITGSCFWFEYDNQKKIIVRDEGEEIVNGENRAGKIYIDGGVGFYYVYFSNEFEENIITETCEELDKTDYTLGLFRSYEMSSEKKLKELEERYNSDYEALKSELQIPGSMEFVFKVMTLDGKGVIEPPRDIPKNVKVMARNLPVQVVYADGDIEYDMLNIQVWK